MVSPLATVIAKGARNSAQVVVDERYELAKRLAATIAQLNEQLCDLGWLFLVSHGSPNSKRGHDYSTFESRGHSPYGPLMTAPKGAVKTMGLL